MTPAAALLVAVALHAQAAVPIEKPPRHHVFIGSFLGAGLTWIGHPEAPRSGAAGVEYDPVFGFYLSPRVALGVQFATWQENGLGDPIHLHAFAPRAEVSLQPFRGPYVITALGFGLTDGSIRGKRMGTAATLGGGYRIQLGPWASLALEGGVHRHAYVGDLRGSATTPFLGLHLRFLGAFGARTQ